VRASLVIARRFLTERRLLVGGVAVGASLTLSLQMAIYPSIRDSLGSMTEGLPDAFVQLIGSSDFASPEGFLQAEAYGTMGPILVILVAISMVSSSLPGAEASGRMTMLATSSVPRRAIGVGVALAVAAAVTLITTVYWVATMVGSAVAGLDIAVSRLSAAAFSLWLLGLSVGAIAFLVGAATGARGATIGVAGTVAVGSFLIYGLLPLSERVAWGRGVSLWYPYAEHEPLVHGADLRNTLLLVGIIMIGTVGGLSRFGRRDLG
jgi:ABC-2 type transport system permease protein